MRLPLIVLDLGGVLMNHDIPRCVAAFQKMMGDNFPRLGLGSDGEGDALMSDFEAGRTSDEEFISSILQWCTPRTTAQNVRDAWNSMHAGIPQERLDTLVRLRKEGFRLYLLSNNNGIHWAHVQSEYRLENYFDGIFLSHLEHCSKPHPELFRRVEATCGAGGADIIFVDDLEANRRAAEELGWRTVSTLEELLSLL